VEAFAKQLLSNISRPCALARLCRVRPTPEGLCPESGCAAWTTLPGVEQARQTHAATLLRRGAHSAQSSKCGSC